MMPRSRWQRLLYLALRLPLLLVTFAVTQTTTRAVDGLAGLVSQAGFDVVSHETFELEPVAPYQLLREEGLMNTLRTFTRVLTNPSNLMRLSAVSDYFKRFPGYFGYGIYVGSKPAGD